MGRDGENKTNILYGFPSMLCQNSSSIMGLRIYGEVRNQIPLSTSTTLDALAKDTH